MVEVIHDGATAGYADFDNRSLARDRVAVTNLPIIDLAPFLHDSTRAERMRVARELRAACIDIGFFYLVGHGFSNDDLDTVLGQGHRFFDLPLDEKLKVESPNVDVPGYVRTGGGVKPEGGGVTDLKERYSMARELMPGEQPRPRSRTGKSIWPGSGVAPGFEPTMKDYIERLLRTAAALNRALALSLDLPEDYFDRSYQQPTVALMLNHYPPLDPAAMKATQWSFSPHTDYTAFTILLQDNSGGLQARNSAGDWIDVPPKDGTFVVNIGDLLARWTNDVYTSTLHRALHIGTAKTRLSAAFFVYPDPTALISCLDTCRGPDNLPRYEDVETEEYSRTLREQARRTGRPGLSVGTAQRLKNAQST